MIVGNNRSPTGPRTANVVKKPEGPVSDYPISSVLVVVGLGVAVGVVLGSILGSSPAPAPSLAKRTEVAAERLGRQMVGAIAGVLPESLSKHIPS
jgi:hypothetical protein